LKKNEEYAFYGCRSLTSFVIPDSVTTIGNYAFYKCPGVQEKLKDEKMKRSKDEKKINLN